MLDVQSLLEIYHMSRKAMPFILGAFILINTAHADELLDRCASPNGHSESEIETLWHQGVIDRRADCINALLSNARFNSRGMAQRLIAKLAQDDQLFVLHNALRMDEIWTEPQKGGERIAGFRAITTGYVEIFHANGIQVTKEQLLSKNGRNELMRLLSSRQPSTDEEPPSSTPWSIIVVLIVAATGLLWLLLKKRK